MEKVIKNGLVFDAIHEEPYTADILVKDGKIAAIGENLDAPGAEVIDASGQHVYPGFVDAHSHLGMIDSGMGFEGSDCNEPTDPLTPQLRGLDGFYAMDPDVHTAAAAGVTTVCTGPGSANVVGGTFMAVKTYGKRVDNMVINPCVAMKCAFGENPKRVYRTANNASRMATASKLRELILKTIEYDRKIKEAGDDPTKLPKFDFKLDAMLPVIRKEIPLKAHAHRTDDIFTAIRIAKEFGLKLTLEHVTEGHLIVDELMKENLPMAVGPSFGQATKVEIREKILQDPRHPRQSRRPGLDHHRRPRHPPAVPAPLRRTGNQVGDGALCGPPGDHHQPRQTHRRRRPGRQPRSGQGRRYRHHARQLL